ncbi:Ldh family oxidoreductase [Rouxiella badensis]|uniref:Ldh family oxidoreductase n=1 Tax=Rouxiella badensis TaxID=1646377 RepID=UPI0028D66BAD|nr:Ldh family oxidoreductase [Rouxiella badensis]
MRQLPTFQAEVLRKQTEIILTGWGMPDDIATQTAELIIETDLLGIDSHGISMLPHYHRLLQAGKWRPAARAKIINETPATAVIDGGHSLGHATSLLAIKTAVEKAKTLGLASVVVRHSNHFGAAGLYARYAASQGLIGLVTSTTRGAILVPTGAASAVLGTNPIAFSAPAGKNADFVLDMATTTVAANKVKVYDFYSKPLPSGWVIDENGQPVTDSALAVNNIFQTPKGGLTPVGGAEETGGHKGYGLAMLAQILAGPLAGAAFGATNDKEGMPNVGHFFLVLDPKAFRRENGFKQDLDEIIDTLHATSPSDVQRPVLVAGDPENRQHRERSKNGVPLPTALLGQLQQICLHDNFEFILG